ncbi:pyridoxal-dependent decarboxylase [Streptomyces sp. NPDC049916]|uniref:pyridoxal phosphate-dependent decarboxylase family protein n=1 Tax=Streptomyces sp. NPDC049916 TaxID=3155156 RepID=UPI0034212206
MSQDFEAASAEASRLLSDHWRALAQQEPPVFPDLSPGSLLSSLPAAAPEEAEPLADLLEDTWNLVVPGLVHWQHPAFLGYYPTNNSPASVLAELLTAGLGVQGMMWATSPASTELEQVVTDWLAKALGLPEAFCHSSGTGGGVIQDSASSAIVVAIAAGLHRVSRGRWRVTGLRGRRPRLYCSDQANSCVTKGSRVTGLGEPHIIPRTPGTRQLDPHALEVQIAADRAAGLLPAVVVATVGTTGTCAIDSIEEIGRVCRREDVWLHVDAAYAGSAALCPEFRHVNDGVGLADSYAVNAHKWLRAGNPCDVLWTTDRASLTGALGITPPYLHHPATESTGVVDFRDWQIPLGRPMRALKLWYVIRAHGLRGLRSVIRHDVRMATLFADLVDQEEGFHLEAAALGLVVFRRTTDEATQTLINRLRSDHSILCTPDIVDGRRVVRAAFGSPYTTPESVRRTWEKIRSHA